MVREANIEYSVLYLGLRRIVMRKYAVLAAAAGLALTGLAKADFIVTNTKSAGTGIFAGDDVYTWKVQNDGTKLTAGTTKLLALDVTMSSPDGGKFFIRTFDSTGGNESTPTDADLANQGGNSPAGSFVRAGSATGFTIVATNPNYQGPDSGNAVHNPTPYSDGQALDSFQVVGSPGLTTGGVSAVNPITFAQSVVPAGQKVHLAGLFGAETGDPQPFTADNVAVPEPASLGLLSLGLGGLMVRRRRA